MRRNVGNYILRILCSYVFIASLCTVFANASENTSSGLMPLPDPSALTSTADETPVTAHSEFNVTAIDKTTSGDAEKDFDVSSGWKDSTLYDIVVAAIGAFFGYGFALVVEHQLLARKRRKCITNIALELKDLKTRLERSANDPAIPSALSYSIHTPIWETVVGNGDILELKTKKLRDCYDVLFRVYSSIEKLSVLENSTREKDGAAIINEVLGMRRAVLKLFDEDPLKSLIDDCE